MRADVPTPQEVTPPAVSPPDQTRQCVRCGLVAVVDDDGFCDACAKAVEQACL